MTEEVAIPIATIVANLLITIIGSWLMFRAQISRTPSQNARDDMDTAKIALEISEKATLKQLELTQEVNNLKKILKNQHYKVVVIFSLGEIPRIESASVEAITDLRHHIVAVE